MNSSKTTAQVKISKLECNSIIRRTKEASGWTGPKGWAVYVLHDPWRIRSKYKRGRGREIVAETIPSWTPEALLVRRPELV
jgi:hypothetical protein